MDCHLVALNAFNADALVKTLHFPHYRLVGPKLDYWETPDTYLVDFLKRAGDKWARTQWASIDIQKDSADKVHLAVRINRFDADDGLIADFESLWVITLINNKWAAQFRSSFAAL
jgi:hypothetical protein